MARIKLNISNLSEPLPTEIEDRIMEETANGIEVLSKVEDFPMPWDAAAYIEGDMFIIDGNLGQQGSHKGFAKVGIPLNQVSRYVDISIYTENDNEELVDILSDYGWL